MAGIRSFGVQLKVATNVIGGLKTVTVPETDVSFVDVTTHDSPDGFREFVGGLKDGGTLQYSGNYLIANAGQIYLRNKNNQGGEPVACEVIFSDGSKATFDAVVGGVSTEAGEDDAVSISGSLRISGAVTYVAPS